MTEAVRTDTAAYADPIADARRAVLAAALPHVVFDGWSDKTLAYAVEDAGIDPARARLAYHRDCDRKLAERLAAEDLQGLRFRDRIAHAIALRLEICAPEREAVRRAAALFALPHLAPEGARAIWHTADTIWTALGDESRDYNWYTKRMTLAGVYSSCVLYWLGDDSPGFRATRDFIHRRIDDVMQIEQVKARLRKNPIAKVMMAGPRRILDRVKAPGDTAASDLPGHWRGEAEY